MSEAKLKSMTGISELSAQLTKSMRRPCGRTLRLIDKALSYLVPFESAKADVASGFEKKELLGLIHTHRQTLSPYLNIDRIEWNLRTKK